MTVTTYVCKSMTEFSIILLLSWLGSGVLGFWIANVMVWTYKRLTKKEGA